MNSNQTNFEDLLTPDELAARLRVSPQFVYARSRRGAKNGLPVMRVGRVLRFSWSAVTEWLAKNSEPAIEPAAASQA